MTNLLGMCGASIYCYSEQMGQYQLLFMMEEELRGYRESWREQGDVVTINMVQVGRYIMLC